MVLTYHVVISFYGFWLPNDPRGSNSTFVRSSRLLPFGPATYTPSAAPSPANRTTAPPAGPLGPRSFTTRW